MSIKRHKTKKNATMMVVLTSVAVVISLFTTAVCIFANSSTNPYVGMNKVEGPTYQLEDLNAVEGVAMAKADAVELYKGMGTLDSIDLKGLENSILKANAQDIDAMNNAQVPEPATLTLLTLGGLAMLRKSRKNKKN